jgi:hypothetical protein
VQDDTDADFIRIPRPRSIVRWLLYLLHLRTQRVTARDRGYTITSVTALLSESGRVGTVDSRQRDDRWSVTLGPAAGGPTSSENQ